MKAAIFRQANEPLTIESVEIDRPMSHEVLVRTVASGVCHSDYHYVDGSSVPMQPGAMVLGHEPAGIVEEVGDQVTYVRPGDHVVACLSSFCGSCRHCLTGHPNRCRNPITRRGAADPPRLSQDGQPVNPFVNVGSFAEKMLLHESSVIKIANDLPLDRAALVGCGVLTGVGAVLNTAKVEPGSTVAVFGCGGVGLSAIQGAEIAGARQIIGVDTLDAKLDMAKQFGATHTVNASKTDPVEGIMSLTNGEGVDYSFEAIGVPAVVRQAFESLGLGGTATIIGVMPTGSELTLRGTDFLGGEKTLKGSLMGSNRARVDIPNYLELYRAGRLRLDEMVSRRGPLEDINASFAAMKAGEVARGVLIFE